jgi:hypothetical protein
MNSAVFWLARNRLINRRCGCRKKSILYNHLLRTRVNTHIGP